MPHPKKWMQFFKFSNSVNTVVVVITAFYRQDQEQNDQQSAPKK
jgi:hypothetical protein